MALSSDVGVVQIAANDVERQLAERFRQPGRVADQQTNGSAGVDEAANERLADEAGAAEDEAIDDVSAACGFATPRYRKAASGSRRLDPIYTPPRLAPRTQHSIAHPLMPIAPRRMPPAIERCSSPNRLPRRDSLNFDSM